MFVLYLETAFAENLLLDLAALIVWHGLPRQL